MAKVLVRYETNNSGGSWWLTDEDWCNLEEAGWDVDWYRNQKNTYTKKPYEGGRWLGALATKAQKQFDSVKEAIEEFEKVTGQKATDDGCNCCGPPHTFWYGNPKCFDWKCRHTSSESKRHFWTFCSGEECLAILFPDRKIPKNLRTALEEGG